MAESLIELFLRQRSALFGFIRVLTRNTQDAEDIFQEVATIVIEKAAENPDIRNFEAWTKEICRRLILAHFRKLSKKKTVSLPVEEMMFLAGEVYENNTLPSEDLLEEHDAMRNCLSGMPDKTAKMIRMRFGHDESYLDIAQKVKGTESAVRRAVSRARIALVECVRRRLGQLGETS